MRLASCAAALLLSCAATPAPPLPELPQLPAGRCVLDEPKILRPETLVTLQRICVGLDRSHKGQLVVAVVDSLHGRQRLSDLALDLFRAIRLGHKYRDDGVIVVLHPTPPKGKRGIRVTIGYGLERGLTDARLSALIDEVAIPKLRADDFDGALDALATRLVALVEEEDQSGRIDQHAAERRRRGPFETRVRAWLGRERQSDRLLRREHAVRDLQAIGLQQRSTMVDLTRRTYLILEMPPAPWVEQVHDFRAKHEPWRRQLPVEITLIGSSGVGVFEAGQDFAEATRLIDGLAASLPPFTFRFRGRNRFPGTSIVYFEPEAPSEFLRLHQRIVSIGFRFLPNQYPYTPHCTVAILAEGAAQAAALSEFERLPIPTEWITVTGISFFQLDEGVCERVHLSPFGPHR